MGFGGGGGDEVDVCGSSREVHASFARRKLARYSITEPRASRLSCDQSSCPGIALSFQKMIPTSPSRPFAGVLIPGAGANGGEAVEVGDDGRGDLPV